MHEQASPCPEHGITEREDEAAQRAVLAVVFAQHPTQLTICELAREINQDEDFAATDAVERAIRDLVGAGVLRCEGVAIRPTRPAANLHRLWT